tara:strand:- start:1368 stop:1547 length:180 start_codon:yes stop_codon:yes gene_type:complete
MKTNQKLEEEEEEEEKKKKVKSTKTSHTTQEEQTYLFPPHLFYDPVRSHLKPLAMPTLS